jgi:hypothetical protein
MERNNEPVKHYKALLTWKPPYDDLLPFLESKVLPSQNHPYNENDFQYFEDRKTLTRNLFYRKLTTDALGVSLVAYWMKRFLAGGGGHDDADSWKRNDEEEENREQTVIDAFNVVFQDTGCRKSELFKQGYLDHDIYEVQVFEADNEQDLQDVVIGLSGSAKKVGVLEEGINTSYEIWDKLAREEHRQRHERMNEMSDEELREGFRKFMLNDRI